MFTELHELAVYSADVAELGGSKLGQVGLSHSQHDNNHGDAAYTYIYVESNYGILLAIALEPRDLRLELVVLLLTLRACSMVPLRLLTLLRSLLLGVRVLRQLRRILAGLLLLLLLLLRRVGFAILCRCSAGAVLLGVVAHVSILLRVLAVRRRGRRQRR